MSKENDQPIECRTAVELSGIISNEITYLPAGMHSITPIGGGIGRAIKVLVDHNASVEIERQRQALQAKGKRPYFDFNHEDGKSSFWPERFEWRPGEGVVACGEWSGSGKKAVKDKDFRAFSPVFYVDNKLGDPAKVVCRENAKPNMGGLVNDPAFSNLPLWAKNDGASVNAGDNGETKQKEKRNMSGEEIAELRAKNQELESKIAEQQALIDANQADAMAESEIKAARAQLEANDLKLQLDANEKVMAKQAESIRQTRETEVDSAIRAAIGRGAILPRDNESQKSLKAKAMEDPLFIQTINKMPGRPELTRHYSTDPTRYTVQSEDPGRVLCKMAEVAAKQMRAGSPREKLLLAREFQSMYAREVSPLIAGDKSQRILGYPLDAVNDSLMAADVTDGSLGTLAGVLVTQRVLELLKYQFPALTSFTTDFSDQPVTYGQTLITRTITVPSAQTYSTASGWPDATAATTDVPVTMNQHKGVPITFNTQILASTVRRLFDEFAEAQAYALGKDMVDALYANITDANFTNNSVKASASVDRAFLVDVQNALNKRGVPMSGRTCLLYSDAFAAIEKDTNLITFAAFQSPSIITQGQSGVKFVIPVAGFDVINAPNLPTNNGNVNGFAGSKSALCIVTRPDNDYTSILPGASYGNVAMVTDPDIGMTVTQVQYVTHTTATATSRVSLIYGTAAGQGNAGQLIKANTSSGSSH